MKRLLECIGWVCAFGVLASVRGGELFAEDVRLAWNPNQAPDVAGYKLHIGTESRKYTATVVVGTSTSYTVTGLGKGTRYFAVTAYDAKGDESGYSNEIFVAIDPSDGGPAPTVRTTGNAATMSWTTARPSSVIFEYGTDLSYGESIQASRALSAEHMIALSGLVPGTTYHFRTRSADSQGNVVISGDRIFTTAGTPDGPAAVVLACPRRPDNGYYTGIALVNLDTIPALVTFKAFDASGVSSGARSDSNAPIRILSPGEQIAVLDSELFGSTSAEGATPDWIEIGSSAPYLVGFFMTFDANLTSVGGTALSNSTTRSLVFSETAPETSPRVMLRNPGETDAVITCDLVGTGGLPLNSVSRTIGARSSLTTSITELFGGGSSESNSYLRVRSDQLLYGYELLESSSQWFPVLAPPPAGPGIKALYAAQYVYGGPWASEIVVVNADLTQDTLILRWIGDDGTQIGRTCTASLPAFGKVQISDLSCFAVPPQQIQQGYVEIKTGQSRIMGNILLRDLEGSRPATSLPLLSELRASYVIPHVASDQRYFTGIAILNPGDSDATVTTEILDSSGGVLATLRENLPFRRRMSRVLTEMFPGLIGRKLLSGYIRITSDSPLAVFALFGTNDLATLTALPAQLAP
jgi:hypothetical protein